MKPGSCPKDSYPRGHSTLLLSEPEWGWGVAVATCFIRVAVPSLRFAFGIVYLNLIQREGMTHLEASSIIGTFMGVFSIVGPISTSFSLYYSHQVLVFIGLILISVGLGLCCLSLRLPWMLGWYGVLGGIGSSMVSSNTFLITQKHFHRRRTAANFLASFGTSLSFLIAPISIYLLIHWFSLRGTFLIWSSIILNTVVGAMFYSPGLNQSNIRKKVKKKKKQDELCPRSSQLEPNSLVGHVHKDDQADSNSNCVDYEALVQLNAAKFKSKFEKKKIENVYEVDNVSMKSLSPTLDYEDCETEEYCDSYSIADRAVSYMSVAMSDESFNTMHSIYMSVDNMFASLEYIDIIGSKTLSTMKYTENAKEEAATRMETSLEAPERSTSFDPNQGNMRARKPLVLCCNIKIPNPKDLISLKPITNCIFLAYCISSVLNKQVHLTYIIYLPIVSMRMGFQKEIPILLAIIASGEFIAKFFVSLISQKKWISIRYFYIFVSLTNSLSCVVLLFCDGFLPLALSSAGLAFGLGMSISIEPLLLVDHFSTEMLRHSYGLLLFVTGVFSILMFPFQGWTVDLSNSFRLLGIILSSLAIVPGILWTMASVYCIGY